MAEEPSARCGWSEPQPPSYTLLEGIDRYSTDTIVKRPTAPIA